MGRQLIITTTTAGNSRSTATSSNESSQFILSWGYNKFQQLGHGNSQDNGDAPRSSEDSSGSGGFVEPIGPVIAANGQDAFRVQVASLSAGWVHCLVVDNLGNCWGWGGNNNATLGGEGVEYGDALPDTITNPPVKFSQVPRPVRIPFPVDVRVANVSCGMFHSLAVDTLGRVWSWGSGNFGKLGHGDEEPRFVPT